MLSADELKQLDRPFFSHAVAGDRLSTWNASTDTLAEVPRRGTVPHSEQGSRMRGESVTCDTGFMHHAMSTHDVPAPRTHVLSYCRRVDLVSPIPAVQSRRVAGDFHAFGTCHVAQALIDADHGRSPPLPGPRFRRCRPEGYLVYCSGDQRSAHPVREECLIIERRLPAAQDRRAPRQCVIGSACSRAGFPVRTAATARRSFVGRASHGEPGNGTV